MTKPDGIDMKLRAAFLVPALAIVVSLMLVSLFITNISYITIWLFPVVVFAALISMILVERKRRRRSSE